MRDETVVSVVVYCMLIKNGYCGDYVQNTRRWKLLEERSGRSRIRAKDARVKERLSAYGTGESFKVARKFNHERAKQPPCHCLWPSVSALYRDSILVRHPNAYPRHVTSCANDPLKSFPNPAHFYACNYIDALQIWYSRPLFVILPFNNNG